MNRKSNRTFPVKGDVRLFLKVEKFFRCIHEKNIFAFMDKYVIIELAENSSDY